jgi:hypothetical protein
MRRCDSLQFALNEIPKLAAEVALPQEHKQVAQTQNLPITKIILDHLYGISLTAQT